jgi:hypothetical protein
MKPKQDPRVVFKNVFNFKEYYEELKEVDVVKFLRFIPMAYDKNSPLRSHFTETVRLKIKAADLAGFVRQDDGRFLSNVENVLNGGNEIANRMIIRYVVQHKNSLYTRFVMYQELYENEMNKLRSGEKGAAKISEFDTLGDKLDEIRQSLGLEREPYFAFHLTLGHANEKWIEHSEYILRQCKRFNLISSEPRRFFNEDRVIIFSSQEKEL